MEVEQLLALVPVLSSIFAVLTVMVSLKARVKAEKEFIKAIEAELEALKNYPNLLGVNLESERPSALEISHHQHEGPLPSPADLSAYETEDVKAKLLALQGLKEKYLASLEMTKLNDSGVIVRALEKMKDDDRRQIKQTLSRYTDIARVRYLETVLDRVAKAVSTKGKIGLL